MAKKIDSQALSAAMAGFLACHVLTCRFLVQEGAIDKEKFITFLKNAMEDMRPGIEDQRSLFPLSRLIDSLRAASTDNMLQ